MTDHREQDKPQAAHGCCDIDDDGPEREPMGLPGGIFWAIVVTLGVAAIAHAVARYWPW